MATFFVNTAEDESFTGGTLATEGADGSGLSLREAIGLANATGTDDRIVFSSSLNGEQLALTLGTIFITQTLDIDGATAGSDGVIISGDVNGDDRDENGLTLVGGGSGITDIQQSAGVLSDNETVFNITGGTTDVEMNNLTITGGRGNSDGGGIRSNAGDLTLTEVAVRGNYTNSSALDGGGIAIFGGSNTLTLNSSTVSGNATFNDSTSQGGGIYSGGATIRLFNSTVAENWTEGTDADGGGIGSFGDVYVTNSTITSNYTLGTSSDGGGIWVSGGDTATVTNSIVSGNVAVNATDDDVSGTQVLPGNNIIDQRLFIGGAQQPGSITAGSVFESTATVGGTTTRGGQLGDNGGFVQTVALVADAGNVAIDGSSDPFADDALGNPLTTDARGQTRNVDAPLVTANDPNQIDIGAFELQGDRSLVVTTADDVVAIGDGLTSLREAIAFANLNGGADTITFDPGLNGAVLRLTQGQIEISDELTIDGASAGDEGVVISGDANGDDRDADGNTLAAGGTGITDLGTTGAARRDDNSRVFYASGGADSVAMNNLTITGGAGRATAGGYGSDGGGIRSNADLLLTDVAIRGNYTNGSADDGGGVAVMYGGATLTMVNSTVSGNATFTGGTSGGGGIHSQGGDIRLFNTTVSDNWTEGTSSGGGGIQAYGAAYLTNSTVTGNYTLDATSNGGGILSYYAGGSVTLINSIVAGNVAVAGSDNNVSNATLSLAGGNIVDDTLSLNGTPLQVGITANDVFDTTANIAGSGVRGGVAADNGGPVQTVALAKDFTNPALDAGIDALADGPTGAPLGTDARGLDRTVDQTPAGANDVDLGAFEAINLIIGTGGDDTIIGTLNPDCIIGLAGDDEIEGRGGDDEITGSRDRDVIFGDNGNDTINGAAGADYIEGGNGGDRLSGGDQNDTIFGGNANDTIFGGNNFDTLDGGSGNDGLNGGNGNDRLIDGDNRDTLTGGGASDTFVLIEDNFRDKITDFQDGTDFIELSGFTFGDLTIFDIGTGAVRINYGTDVLIVQEGAGPLEAADFSAADFIFV